MAVFVFAVTKFAPENCLFFKAKTPQLFIFEIAYKKNV